MPDYAIKDIKLAPGGQLKIDWVRDHMPVLNHIREEFERDRPFDGVRVALSIHLEAKTAYLAEVIRAGGAAVTVTGSNPLSTQDDVAAALAAAGIKVYAWYNASDQEYRDHLLQALDTRPQVVIDDGGDLVTLLHTTRRELAGEVIGGCEETTTGIRRLEALDREGKLLFPMFAVNNAQCKFLFDNRYGTGESVWSAIMRTTNLVVAGKTVVVMGYGWCGKGVAMRAKGLGANVIVCEVDPVRAIEACMDGYQVMHSKEAAAYGDIFVTVTGSRDVLTKHHFTKMKDGAILSNAGHFDVEINKHDLKAVAVEQGQARHNIEQFILKDGRKLYLLAEGRLVNLAAGDGHPAEIMDMSFAVQALTVRHIMANRQQFQRKLYRVPAEIDRRVATLKLKSMGVVIDSLTIEQEAYLREWHE
ncbi:MAG: adenosylhomocysteinase [Desulfotomaculaceae bacterium]|nr:adenosylhomocysteinase [Desulfotomaculaceae bacterium]